MPEPHLPPTPRHSDELETLLRARTRARGTRRRAVLTGVPLVAVASLAVGGWALSRGGEPDVSITIGAPTGRELFRVRPDDLPEDLPATLRTMLSEGLAKPIRVDRLERLTTFQDNLDRYEMWLAPNAEGPGNQVFVGSENLSFVLDTLRPGAPCFAQTNRVGACSTIGGNAYYPVIGWADSPRVRAVFDTGPDVVVTVNKGLFLVGGGQGRTLVGLVAEDADGREIDVSPLNTGGDSTLRCAPSPTGPADAAGLRTAGDSRLTIGPFTGREAVLDIGTGDAQEPVAIEARLSGARTTRLRIRRTDGFPGIAVFDRTYLGSDAQRTRAATLPPGASPHYVVFSGAGCYRLEATLPDGRWSVTIRARASAVATSPTSPTLPNRRDYRFGYQRSALPRDVPGKLAAYLNNPGASAPIRPATLTRRVPATGATRGYSLWSADGVDNDEVLFSVAERTGAADPVEQTDQGLVPREPCRARSDGLRVVACSKYRDGGIVAVGRVAANVDRVEILTISKRRVRAVIRAGYFLAVTDERDSPLVAIGFDASGTQVARAPVDQFGPDGDLGALPPTLVKVPDTNGLSLADAERMVRDAGLSPRVARGQGRQDPPPGNAVPRGAVVVIREPTATPRFAPALAILERAAVPSDAAADLRERAKSVYRIDPGDMRLARAAGGERIYVGENGARRICLIIEGTHGGVHCGGRGDLARAGMIALPFSRAAGDRRLVGVVVDGFDTAVAPGGRARIVDNVLVLPLGDRARSVTVSGPRGRFTYRLE